ncbi:MAG TPA: M15 family metallopeptidase [Nitrososphaera sp.]|nr:M15 family metallopeptidase [Nitrososphaera sp.]
MRSTSQLRSLWGPACSRRQRTNMEQAYRALDAGFKAWNYRPKSGQTFGYACRRITGGSGYSLHAYADNSDYRFWTGVSVPMAVAVDINSLANPYGRRLKTDMPRAMVDAILRIRTNGGVQVWTWGGYWSGNKDAMHFQLNCSPAELSKGINWSTVPGGSNVPGPSEPDTPEDDDPMHYIRMNNQAVVYQVHGNHLEAVGNEADLDYLTYGKKFSVVEVVAPTSPAWFKPEMVADANGVVKFRRVPGSDPR